MHCSDFSRGCLSFTSKWHFLILSHFASSKTTNLIFCSLHMTEEVRNYIFVRSGNNT